jgi:hypothetical protein
MKTGNDLSRATARDVDALFAERSAELHAKVDATRDAYFGFIFPVNRSDFATVIRALGLGDEAAAALLVRGTAFSSFRSRRRGRQITNHIVGGSVLALRGRDLDSGLSGVTDSSLSKLVAGHVETVAEIADARSSWFGRVFFPAQAFANAIGVFGGKVSAQAIYRLAEEYGYAAEAGERQTVRGDFGIAVWLTLLAHG